MVATLRDLLASTLAGARVPEREWVDLVRSVAAGDRHALHALRARSAGLATTLSFRITRSAELADELALDVFDDDVWRNAATYDASMGSVLGWILNLTRSRALERLRSGRRERRDRSDNGAAFQPAQPWLEPAWSDVAPGISCKALAMNPENGCLSLLVRLEPGAHYPPHRHAGAEEIHLLDGELWIDYQKLVAGDYSRREAATEDYRVWSKTGCTCFLMTSADDELR